MDVLFGPGDAPKVARLREAANSTKPASGKTHTFYKYPARFSPEFAEAVISELTLPGDWVLDPFSGGGTSVIEALALGRKVIGVDINALAQFVTRVSTTPLSQKDERVIGSWAEKTSTQLGFSSQCASDHLTIRNFPPALGRFMFGAIACAEAEMALPRRRDFARCALLGLGQWALESVRHQSRIASVASNRLPTVVQAMIEGQRQLVERCNLSGVQKNKITEHRVLINRSTIGLENEPNVRALHRQVRLVITSPPYPGVHVLYHRWQYRGRRETDAPYWLANLNDGRGESYYTFGNRKSMSGVDNYFTNLYMSFRSVRPFLARNALVVQLVSFGDPKAHLPRFLNAMARAGYEGFQLSWDVTKRLRRRVPNRKWYTQISANNHAGSEILLVHKRGGS